MCGCELEPIPAVTQQEVMSGQTHRDKQPFILVVTPMFNLGTAINQTLFMYMQILDLSCKSQRVQCGFRMCERTSDWMPPFFPSYPTLQKPSGVLHQRGEWEWCEIWPQGAVINMFMRVWERECEINRHSIWSTVYNEKCVVVKIYRFLRHKLQKSLH